MKLTIYGLTYDYFQQNGNFLILYRNPPMSIYEMERNQEKMLQAVSVPGLLPLIFDELNMEVRFRYDITNKRMLSHYVKTNKMTMKDYFQLFYSIVSVLDDSKIYLLSEQNYILKEPFIFAGSDFSEIHLAYLPLKSITDKESTAVELKQLALKLISNVDELMGDGFQQFMQLLEKDYVHLGELRKKLLHWMKDVMPHNNILESRTIYSAPPIEELETKREAEPGNSKSLWGKSKSTSGGDAIEEEKRAEVALSSFFKEWEHFNDEELSAVVESSGGLSAASKQHQTNRITLYIYLGAILVMALVWRMYLSLSIPLMLYVCIGTTVFCLVSAFLLAQQLRTKPQHERGTFHFEQQISSPFFSEPRGDDLSQNSHGEKEEDDSYYERLPEQTQLLVDSDATVFLQESTVLLTDNNQDRVKAYLLKENGSTADRIEIKEDRFVIGRGPNGVQYVESTTGVSRAHLEIFKDGTHFLVKDLGSRNGTYLNEQLLTPYKPYPIQDGDQIKIVRTPFVFKTDTVHV